MNPKRPTPRHIIIKIPKIKEKEKILKASREKQLVTYKGALTRLSAFSSTETLQTRKSWQKIFKVIALLGKVRLVADPCFSSF